MQNFRLSIVILFASGFALHAHAEDETGPDSKPAIKVSLKNEMEVMDKDFNVIRRQVSDSSQNTTTLQTLSDMELHTLAAKSALPRSATTMPTTQENTEKASDYLSTMLNLLRDELDLEEQLRGNHNDKAADIVKTMHDLEGDGHKEFRPRRNRGRPNP